MRLYLFLQRACLILTVTVVVYDMMLKLYTWKNRIKLIADVRSHISTESNYHNAYEQQNVRTINIAWPDPPNFLRNRPEAMFIGFSGCIHKNCKISYNLSDAKHSDAVVFSSHLLPTVHQSAQRLGQIWILFENEPPYKYDEKNETWWKSYGFNWTMTYDRNNADIHLPYGEIKPRLEQKKINIETIRIQKNRTALTVLSDCDTPAERMRYIEELRKYIDVDVFGDCGAAWHCGQKLVPGDCFEVLKFYKFYLAFENSFCNNYFTEKVFETFDYEAVLVSRGGLKGQSRRSIPEGTFIAADDFKNAKELGNYLKSMPFEKYIDILKKKAAYTAINGYTSVFYTSMCDLCYRLNNLNIFQKSVDDMNEWAFYSSKNCKLPDDLGNDS